MKKKVLIVIAIIIFVILLIPHPVYVKDGGTVRYEAALYTVVDFHCINPDIESDKEFIEGISVEILGFEVYDDIEWPSK